ncbi:Uncharacterised protein [Mycobacteroides abscessus subsp. abscessus]|nr:MULTISPECIES: hypothetical protein [Mycobacteroides]SII97244.1 Uncharacterised protein [Mycobacteroides abscessus subsp. abscessus]
MPINSELVTALNGGQRKWSNIEHLLADIWAVLVKLLGDPKKVPENIDHPARAEMTAKAKSDHKQGLKARYLKRKAARRNT